MNKLKIYNEVKGFRVPRTRLGRAFDSFLKKSGAGVGEVSLIFVGEGKVKELNEKWYGGKGATDVLTFDYEGGVGDVAGEIYVCVKIAEKNASAEGKGVMDEVLWLFVHGLLHLAGHTHENDRKYDDMMKRAGEILGRI
jgi:probable rRNA maturation factor